VFIPWPLIGIIEVIVQQCKEKLFKSYYSTDGISESVRKIPVIDYEEVSRKLIRV
jgi:hypothetical protein